MNRFPLSPLLSYTSLIGRRNLNRLNQIQRGANQPNLLFHMVQLVHDYFGGSPTNFKGMAARFIPTHSHNNPNLISSAERLVTRLNPNMAENVFSTDSSVAVFPGTREQMIENVINMYKNCLGSVYIAHKQAEDYIARETNNSEILTRGSFPEFSGHPGRFDGPFTEQEAQYIIKEVLDFCNKIVGPLDRNFIFNLTLAISKKVDTPEGIKNVEYNAFYSFGRGIGLDLSTCVSSLQAPEIQIVTFAKKNISDLDIEYKGTLPYTGDSPNATPLPQGNALNHLGVTTGGNLYVQVNEICRDHAMRYAVQEFAKFMENMALTDPHAFVYLMNNPKVFHEILSSSVTPEPDNILSSHFALTDQKFQLRGVYTFDQLNDYYRRKGPRPSEDTNKSGAKEWDLNLSADLKTYGVKCTSVNKVPENPGQSSGLTTEEYNYEPIPTPSFSPVARTIVENIALRNQAGLEQARSDMGGKAVMVKQDVELKRDPDSGPSTPGLQNK